jgi:hypothetical protein
MIVRVLVFLRSGFCLLGRGCRCLVFFSHFGGIQIYAFQMGGRGAGLYRCTCARNY